MTNPNVFGGIGQVENLQNKKTVGKTISSRGTTVLFIPSSYGNGEWESFERKF